MRKCSGGVNISYPRLRLEIILRYVGPPVQTCFLLIFADITPSIEVLWNCRTRLSLGRRSTGHRQRRTGRLQRVSFADDIKTRIVMRATHVDNLMLFRLPFKHVQRIFQSNIYTRY